MAGGQLLSWNGTAAEAWHSYVDAWHKPEMICALTEFRALGGFRPVGIARKSERDADGRGWHDRICRTVVIRSR